MEQLTHFLQELQLNAYVREAIRLGIYLVIGGLCGMYIRALHLRFGLAVANRNAISSNFAILIVTTVLVIFVVKSSLALSLGLVGALSIVRFRAAIKEPEELVVLFFCIAVGLALGAEYPELAITGVFIFTLFMLQRHWTGRKGAGDTLLLTISGPRSALLDGKPDHLLATLRQTVGAFTIQRLDVEEEQVQLRAVIAPDLPEQVLGTVETLRTAFPGCSVSYVSLANLL